MIQGERITLRAITPADYPRLTEFKNDFEFELLGGGMPPKPRTRAGVTEFFDQVTGSGDPVLHRGRLCRGGPAARPRLVGRRVRRPRADGGFQGMNLA